MNDDKIPQAALDDFAEYQRRGGRFDRAGGWDRYREDYADGR